MLILEIVSFRDVAGIIIIKISRDKLGLGLVLLARAHVSIENSSNLFMTDIH